MSLSNFRLQKNPFVKDILLSLFGIVLLLAIVKSCEIEHPAYAYLPDTVKEYVSKNKGEE